MRYSVFLATLLTLNTLAFADNYKLDPAHTEIGFSVKHLLISNVKGRFEKFSGTFQYDKKLKTLTDLKIDIEANSISTNEKNRDEHLNSDDFFNTKKFKNISFVSEKAEFDSSGEKIKLTGQLKIKNISKPLVLDVSINGEAEIGGVKKIAFTAVGEINRKNWDISWNQDLDKGGLAVSEEVKIIIEGQAKLITKPAASN
jgi:polyisoprenoid-binding protein YceI